MVEVMMKTDLSLTVWGNLKMHALPQWIPLVSSAGLGIWFIFIAYYLATIAV